MTSASAVAFSVNGNFDAAVTGFEQLLISDAPGVADATPIPYTVDLSMLTYDYVTTSGTAGGDGDYLVLDNMASDGTVVLGADGLVTVNVVDAGEAGHDSDVLNVILQGTSVASVLTANDVETINIDVRWGTSGLDLAADSVTTINVNGSGDLDLVDTTATPPAVTQTSLTLLDASSMWGDLTAGTNGTVSQTILGGWGADNLTANGSEDVLNGGAGDDTLVAGNLASLTGGTGVDTFDMSVLTTNVNSYATIQDASTGDIIETSGLTFSASGITLASTAVFQDYANAAINDTIAGDLTWFEFDGNTYVIDNNSAGTEFDSTADFIIAISGVVDLSTASFNETQGTIEFA